MGVFFKNEHKPAVPSKYVEKITAIHHTDDFVWMGREDGIVDFFNDSVKSSTKVFEVTFDCLESEDIKEKITSVASMTDGGINNVIFVGNERSIKTIKIRNDAPTERICNGELSSNFRFTELNQCQNIHSYVLNSISISIGREHLITSDYLRVNLWNPVLMNSFYNLVDIKSQLTGGAVFVINSTKFSPYKDTIFGYSTSNGLLKINDTSVTPKSESIMYFSNQNTENIRSISDFAFVDSNLIVTRSMNNLCVFDMRNPKKELINKDLVTDSHELNELNSGEAIYDKFKIASDGVNAYTGSYFGSVYNFNLVNMQLEEIQISKERRFTQNNRIKIVSCNENGFSCAHEGSLLNYDIDKNIEKV